MRDENMLADYLRQSLGQLIVEETALAKSALERGDEDTHHWHLSRLTVYRRVLVMVRACMAGLTFRGHV